MNKLNFVKLWSEVRIKLRLAIAKTRYSNIPWDGQVFVELPLAAPYPANWVLRIIGFGERISECFEVYLLEREKSGDLGTLGSRLTEASGHTPLLIAIFDLLKAPECWSDSALEEAWQNFVAAGNFNGQYNGNEEITEDFLHFKAGTNRWEVWKWFNKHYSKGTLRLMFEEEEVPAKEEPKANPQFLVYAYPSGEEPFHKLCTEHEVIELLGFRDCSLTEYEVYDLVSCGYPVKLDEVALLHEPTNHHALVNPKTGETVIDGYSAEH